MRTKKEIQQFRDDLIIDLQFMEMCKSRKGVLFNTFMQYPGLSEEMIDEAIKNGSVAFNIVSWVLGAEDEDVNAIARDQKKRAAQIRKLMGW